MHVMRLISNPYLVLSVYQMLPFLLFSLFLLFSFSHLILFSSQSLSQCHKLNTPVYLNEFSCRDFAFYTVYAAGAFHRNVHPELFP